MKINFGMFLPLPNIFFLNNTPIDGTESFDKEKIGEFSLPITKDSQSQARGETHLLLLGKELELVLHTPLLS